MQIRELILGFGQHQTLNPKIWDNKNLRPEVKDKLLKIADYFKKFIDIDVPVLDIQITGGQASFHYTDHSDLDLHLIIDYNKIDCDQEVKELLDSKRLLFKQQHQIEILGIPVEPGTEDINQPTVSTAYSLIKDQWIRSPKNYSQQIDKKSILKTTDQWTKIISHVLGQNDIEMIEKCLKSIRKYRKIGLKKTGEYGVENLVYKTLRNRGLIAKLDQHLKKHMDKQLGIK